MVFVFGLQIGGHPKGNRLKNSNSFKWCNFSVISSASHHTKRALDKTDFPKLRKSQGRADQRKSIVLLGGKGKGDVNTMLGCGQRKLSSSPVWEHFTNPLRVHQSGRDEENGPAPQILYHGLFTIGRKWSVSEAPYPHLGRLLQSPTNGTGAPTSCTSEILLLWIIHYSSASLKAWKQTAWSFWSRTLQQYHIFFLISSCY